MLEMSPSNIWELSRSQAKVLISSKTGALKVKKTWYNYNSNKYGNVAYPVPECVDDDTADHVLNVMCREQCQCHGGPRTKQAMRYRKVPILKRISERIKLFIGMFIDSKLETYNLNQ